MLQQQSSANISVRECFHFLSVYSQKWDCYILWSSFFFFFNILRNSTYSFSMVAAPIYISTSIAVSCLFSISSPPLSSISWLFYDGHSTRCEVVCHCSFALHFLLRAALGIGRVWVQSQSLPVLFFQGQYSSHPCAVLWKPGWHSDKKIHLPMQERCGFEPWVGKIPWKRKMVTHFSFFLGSPMDRGDCRAIVHGGHKELDMTEHICTHVHILNNFLPTEAKSVCTGLMTQKPIPGGIAKSDC